MNDMRLTEHFTMAEAMASDTARCRGIDNLPPPEVIPALQLSAAGMERIRTLLGGHAIQILSWYRCEALNHAVCGEADSQHLKGEAIDFICPKFGTPRQVALVLADVMRDMGIDQLILEPTWVHCSFTASPRRIALTCAREPGKGRRVYQPGIKPF